MALKLAAKLAPVDWLAKAAEIRAKRVGSISASFERCTNPASVALDAAACGRNAARFLENSIS